MKLPGICLLIQLTMISSCIAQKDIVVSGTVLDAKTRQPLVNAGIGLKNRSYNTTSDMEGNFEFLVPDNTLDDSLFISYVGYYTITDKLSNLDFRHGIFLLEGSATMLDEVTILEKRLYKFEIRRLESSLKLIKGDLYAFDTEVTNKEYNQFLSYLIESNQKYLFEKYKPDIAHYTGPLLSFFKGYHLLHFESKETKYDKSYDDYPIVNISYEAVVAYCEWLTDLYNKTAGKRKFMQVKFRLPALKEWQMAALGYKKFQSWNLEENDVEVGIPKNPGDEVAIKKRTIPVKGSNILYPWFFVFDIRDKAQNRKNCWLGNFKIPPGSASCMRYQPGGDGHTITSPVGRYFPNGMGLYDVVGNVAEMIDEKSKACGGSWDHDPKESTITSVNNYLGPNGSVGFRIFMEVTVKK